MVDSWRSSVQAIAVRCAEDSSCKLTRAPLDALWFVTRAAASVYVDTVKVAISASWSSKVDVASELYCQSSYADYRSQSGWSELAVDPARWHKAIIVLSVKICKVN